MCGVGGEVKEGGEGRGREGVGKRWDGRGREWWGGKGGDVCRSGKEGDVCRSGKEVGKGGVGKREM